MSKVRMQRFGKESRLLRPDEFEKVRKGGVFVRCRGLVVSALQGETKRLGIAVSKRCGNAVQRNRIKRVVREFFRQNRDAFPNGDSVVIPATGAGRMENSEVRAALESALRKLREKL